MRRTVIAICVLLAVLLYASVRVSQMVRESRLRDEFDRFGSKTSFVKMEQGSLYQLVVGKFVGWARGGYDAGVARFEVLGSDMKLSEVSIKLLLHDDEGCLLPGTSDVPLDASRDEICSLYKDFLRDSFKLGSSYELSFSLDIYKYFDNLDGGKGGEIEKGVVKRLLEIYKRDLNQDDTEIVVSGVGLSRIKGPLLVMKRPSLVE